MCKAELKNGLQSESIWKEPVSAALRPSALTQTLEQRHPHCPSAQWMDARERRASGRSEVKWSDLEVNWVSLPSLQQHLHSYSHTHTHIQTHTHHLNGIWRAENVLIMLLDSYRSTCLLTALVYAVFFFLSSPNINNEDGAPFLDKCNN